MAEVEQQLKFDLLQRIDQANLILSKIVQVNIDGVAKLRNKTKQELSFLKKIHSSGNVKKDHLSCSNLKHLEAVADELLKNEDICVCVMCNKTLSDEYGSLKKLCVDLVLHGGSMWVKVIARNPKALTLLSAGEGCYGQRSILEQAEQFLECAEQNLHYYKQPVVLFHFASGIETVLADELEDLGIVVTGIRLDPDSDYAVPYQNTLDLTSARSRDPEEEDVMVKCPVREFEIVNNLKVIEELENKKLNLCVTTMIAYVSALTNGGCQQSFETDILKMHARWERARPVKPILDTLFEGRELYCCQTAATNFNDILTTLGGPGERQRGEELLRRLTIVEDSPTDKLDMGGRVKFRSVAIFGTGESLKAVTVTANHAFVRSALNKGVNFPVFLHESRALTEGKQMGVEGS